jgi:hypothetical protein
MTFEPTIKIIFDKPITSRVINDYELSLEPFSDVRTLELNITTDTEKTIINIASAIVVTMNRVHTQEDDVNIFDMMYNRISIRQVFRAQDKSLAEVEMTNYFNKLATYLFSIIISDINVVIEDISTTEEFFLNKYNGRSLTIGDLAFIKLYITKKILNK